MFLATGVIAGQDAIACDSAWSGVAQQQDINGNAPAEADGDDATLLSPPDALVPMPARTYQWVAAPGTVADYTNGLHIRAPPALDTWI